MAEQTSQIGPQGDAPGQEGQPLDLGAIGAPASSSQAGEAVSVVVDQERKLAAAILAPAEQPAAQPSPAAAPAELDVAAYQRMRFTEPACWQLVTAVYLDHVGIDPTHVRTVSDWLRRAAAVFRLRLHKDGAGLRQLEEPEDFALVLMWHTAKRQTAHCGVYYRGSVLHATAAGVLYQDMASLRSIYSIMEFLGK